jgi:methionyl-tRNA synthetase
LVWTQRLAKLNRTLGMIGRYTDGKIPVLGKLEPIDEDLKNAFITLPEKLVEFFDNLQFDRAIEAVLESVRQTNKYINDTAPWVLFGEGKQERVETILASCIEALRCASVLLEPIIPDKSKELRAQLGLTGGVKLADATQWGLSPAGIQTQVGEPLFPRIDMEALNADIEVKDVLEHKSEITIDDFAKLELRVGKILHCEQHPKADKLLVLKVKVGPEERTIVSGIRQWYKPEELVGKKVIIVANLKPVKLRGIESQGMILSAEDKDGNLSVSGLEKDIADGSEVR